MMKNVRRNSATAALKSKLTAAGFDILPGDTHIVPVMIRDAARATAIVIAC